jgi:hypothetical protein
LRRATGEKCENGDGEKTFHLASFLLPIPIKRTSYDENDEQKRQETSHCQSSSPGVNPQITAHIGRHRTRKIAVAKKVVTGLSREIQECVRGEDTREKPQDENANDN